MRMTRRRYWVATFITILFCSNIGVGQSVGTDPGLFYGPGINSESLNNTRVGGPEGSSTGWRFLSTHTGNLVSFKHYIIWSTAKSGYNDGDGGTLQYELRTDDGTSSHLPSNTVLATVTLNSPMSGSHFPTLTWSSPVPCLLRRRLPCSPATGCSCTNARNRRWFY